MAAPIPTSPGIRTAAHAIAALGGVLEFAGGVAALKAGLPPELTIMLLFLGTLTGVLVWQSLVKRSRAAWSFVTVICAVMSLCTLFGSAKIRHMLDMSFAMVLLFPFLYAFGCVMLGVLGRDYREGNRTTFSAM
jgi:hypothetical protein